MKNLWLALFICSAAFGSGWLFIKSGAVAFTPASLSNLKFLISADCNASSSSCFSLSGTDITSVTDISSNAYVFSGTVSATKPVLAASQVNGKPAITFGTNAYLKNANNFLGSSSIAFTMHVVFKRGAVNFPYLGIFGGDGTHGADFYLQQVSPYVIMGGGTLLTAYNPCGTTSEAYTSNTTWYALALTHSSGGTWQFYRYSGGTASTSSSSTVNNGGANAANGSFIGNYAAGGLPIGAIEEFAMQTSVATPTELSNMATYINTKLGI